MASLNPDLYQERLRLLVEAPRTAGFSQEELAARITQRQTFVSKVELRESRLDPAEYIQIGRALGIGPFELRKRAEEINGP